MWSSLRLRLLAILVLLALIPPLLITAIVGQRSFADLERQALLLQRQVSARVGGNVTSYVLEHENELTLLDSVNSLGVLGEEAQRSLLKNLLHTQRVFHELVLLDREGLETIRLSRTQVVAANAPASRAGEPEFLVPATERETFFGPVRFDQELREPLMTIAVPLVDRRQGDVVAVLVASLRFKPVWDLLAGLDLSGDADAYVVNQAGQVVAHRSPDIVLRGVTVSLAAAEGRGSGLNKSDVYFSSQVLHFGDQDLLVVAEEPAASALELAVSNTRVTLVVAAASIVAAVVLAVLAAGRIVRPVEALAVAAQAIQGGDFSTRVDASGKDEIGDLARAFQAMKTELQRLVTDLRQEVAERVRAEAALQVANTRLLELDRMKAKFIADISHELRTPIANLSLYLDLLARGKSESRARYETALQEEGSRLVSLSKGILEFSDLQQQMDETRFVALDLNGVADEVLALNEPNARARGLELSFPSRAESPLAWGDPEQLKQVVDQLLQNAIQYTPAGSVRLSTRWTVGRTFIQLVVEDTGMGLDEDEQAHCFERFYRGKRVAQQNIIPGAGLGLAKIKDIVAFHGGWIEVESELDQGSVFTVYLPAAREDAPGPQEPRLNVSLN